MCNQKNRQKIVCVISVKKSLRERGGETAYWAAKIKEQCKEYEYIFVTPDVDKELFDPKNPEKERKWRIILLSECNAVFVYNRKDGNYNKNNFYVGNKYLEEYIKRFI